MTKKQVEKVLREVMDPELQVNIVDLGLIYEIQVKKNEAKQNSVYIVMTLTTPGCPLGGWFVEQVREAVIKEFGLKTEQVMVEITFDPPWSQELMSKEVKEKLGF
jgi:metal-sulfur cluster biosynthetic enzyme